MNKNKTPCLAAGDIARRKDNSTLIDCPKCARTEKNHST